MAKGKSGFVPFKAGGAGKKPAPGFPPKKGAAAAPAKGKKSAPPWIKK